MAGQVKKYSIILLKIFFWIIAPILTLLLIAIIALQLPQTQNFIIGKAVSFLREKLNTEVSLDEINITFPKAILLKGFYLEDQKGDTLLFAERIETDVDLWGLLKNRIQINDFELEGVHANVYRTGPDSAFNYSFIPEAFATDTATTTETDTTSASWDIKVYELNLKNIRARYDDRLTDNLMELNLGELNIDLDKFDLENQIFSIDEIELIDTKAVVAITSEEKPETEDDTTSLDLNLGINLISFKNLDLDYLEKLSGQGMKLQLGELSVKADEIDLPGYKIAIDQITLAGTTFQMFENEKISADTIVQKSTENLDDPTQQYEKHWTVSAANVNLSDFNFIYNNNNVQPIEKGIDFNHLHVMNLDAEVQNILYGKNIIEADLEKFTFREKSGFKITNFVTNLRVDSVKAQLTNLDLSTGASQIKDMIAIGYSSLETIGEDIGSLKIKTNLENTVIAISDVLYIQPSLAVNPYLAGIQDEKFIINSKIEGAVRDLNIESFSVRGLHSTVLELSGSAKGLPEMGNTWFDLNIKQLVTRRRDLERILPDTLLPDSFNLPNKILITGNFKGYTNQFATQAKIRTSLGDMALNATLNGRTQRKDFAGNFSIQDFQLGRLLGQDSTFGLITVKASANGQGLDPETMQANFSINLEKAEIKGYTYNNFIIDGDMANKVVSAKANLKDESIEFAFTGSVDMKPEFPSIKADFNLKGADLQALNFSTDQLAVKGRFLADFEGNSMGNINGDFGVRDVLIVKNGLSYPVDSLLFASINEHQRTDIQIDSDIMTANFKGTINLEDLPKVLKTHINQYYALDQEEPQRDAAKEKKEDLEPQNFEFEIDLKNPALLTDVLVPGITTFIPGTIKGSYNSEESNLQINISIPQIDYTGIVLDTLDLYVDSNEERLNYALSLANITSGSNHVRNFAVVGELFDNNIETQVQITDNKSEVQYQFGGAFRSIEEGFRFVFNPSILLNYQEWAVNNDNFLQFGKGPIFANQVNITRENQQISVNSVKSTAQDSVLQITFKDFSLTTVSNIIEAEEALFNGILNGNLELVNKNKKSAFTSDLTINNLAYLKDTLGNLTLHADNATADKYNVDLKLLGNGNQLGITGYYQATEEANLLNFTIDIPGIDLATLESATAGQLTRMKGYLEGKLNLTGSIQDPDIAGSLGFRNASFNVEYINNYLTISNERIVFNERGINFNSFTILDDKKNPAAINGSILTTDYRNFNFDLQIRTRNFRALNTSAGENEMFYGKIYLDSDIKITGDQNLPVVNMKVGLKEGSSFTYIIPQTMPATAEREGVVEFVDVHGNMGPMLRHLEQDVPDTTRTTIKGIELTANIDINPQTDFTIVIDEEAGDDLNVSGSGTLSFTLNANGNMNLTGRYELSGGSYQLSFYNLVKRKFEIDPGSSIMWSGDPLDAMVDISAIYRLRTSPMELLTRPGTSETEDPRLRQQLPFLVYLNMEGELLNPDISFNIKMPEEEKGALDGRVANRLDMLNQEESDLNKQVFALLVMRRFISDNPLESSGGGGVATAARNSVSNILTQQLNRLSSEYVKGIDLNFNVQSYEDYSTGDSEGRTELEVGLSKQFFNNRVRVTLGGSFDLEGERSRQQENLSNIAGDVSIEYKLTEDGRYRLEAFRESTYEDMLEAELIETGVSFIFTRDYNKLRELFRKPKEEEIVIEEEDNETAEINEEK